jgi:hypothetical protein
MTKAWFLIICHSSTGSEQVLRRLYHEVLNFKIITFSSRSKYKDLHGKEYYYRNNYHNKNHKKYPLPVIAITIK